MNSVSFGSRLCIICLVVLSFVSVACGSTQQHQPVGGLWVSPKNRTLVTTTVIDLQARAYPTSVTDPAIKSVNFTIGIGDPAVWHLLCTVTKPIPGTTDTYECKKDLSKFPIAPGTIGVPAGVIQVSFDPMNSNGQVNYAPNGVHDLAYVPGYSPPSSTANFPNCNGVNLIDDVGKTSCFPIGYDGAVPASFQALSLLMNPEGCCAVTTYNEGGNPGHWDCSKVTLPAEWIHHVVAIKVEKHKVPQSCPS